MAKFEYFKGLTELRGIGAIIIVVAHIELYKLGMGEPSFYEVERTWPIIHAIGRNAIYLFFVISGFLVTYLLLKEQKSTGTINVKKFYIRRMLRIAPLYYLVVGISFFVVPLTLNQTFWRHEEFIQNLISELRYGWNLVFYLTFLPNLSKAAMFPPVFGASQAWFVGVIVQFYFLWPLLIRKFKKNIVGILLFIMLLKPVLIKSLLWLLPSAHPEIMILLRFFDQLKIEFMAMGGLLAWFFLHKEYIIANIFRSKKHFALLLGVLLIFMVLDISAALNALLFTILIGFVMNFEWENRLLKKVGELSYGIYMYHVLVIYGCFSTVHHLFEDFGSVWIVLVEYVLVFTLTYLVSFLSYQYIERYFFRLKTKFENIRLKRR